MGLFDQCLLLSDMDGTFLDAGSKLHKRNVEAVKFFTQEGGYFSLATGRALSSARFYIEEAQINAPAILYNGGLIYDFQKEKTVKLEGLPLKAKAYVKEVMEAVPEAGVVIFTMHSDYLVRKTKETNWYEVPENRYESMKEGYTLDSISDPWIKAAFVGNAVTLHLVEEHCKRYKDMSFILAGKEFYEMMAKGTSKGSSMLVVSDYVGVPFENIFAIGDYNNDIAMVSVAEVGAMPKSAPENIQKYADLVVCPNEKGCVADFVNYLAGLQMERNRK